MRILMLLVIGFAVGCALGIWVFHSGWMLGIAALFLIAFALLRFIRTNRSRKIAAIICLGVSLGLCWMFGYDTLYIDRARNLDGVSREVTIEVTDYSAPHYRGTCGNGKVRIDGVWYKVYYYLSEEYEMYPGDQITASFTFDFTGFGGLDEPTYQQGSGIFLVAYNDEFPDLTLQEKVSVRYFPAYLRKRIVNKLDLLFSDNIAGFARALLIGDTSLLSIEDDAALKISGIRHIVAVSGLHVSILMSIVFLLGRYNRFLNLIISVPVLLLFATMAGFSPSIVRACIMQILIIVAMAFDGEYDTPTALSFAVLILLLINPLVLTSVGFQLSVGCIIGITLFSDKIYNRLMQTKLGPGKDRSFKAKLIRTSFQTIAVTLSTMAVTIPLSAYYFGSVSIISVVTNLLTLWLVSFCFYGIALSCLMSFIVPFLGTVLAWLVSWPIRIVLFIAHVLSRVPFASVSVNNLYFLAWIIFLYAIFIVFLICKKKKPFLFSGLAIAGLCISIACAYTEPRMDNFRVTVLDVGHGQCILLQSKNDCYVVDCGGFSQLSSAEKAAQTLRSSGINKITGLILTHFDYDHAGYAEELLAQIDADQIYIPNAEQDNEIRKSLEHSYSDAIYKVRKEKTVACGTGKITIYPGEAEKEGNESSLCILFQAENCDILITGDRTTAGEKYLLQQMEYAPIDILIVGHHGAKSSTGLNFLQNIQPLTAVISVGEDNPYGHPNVETLNRLKRFGCTVWRTDLDGTIVFRG